MKTSFCDNVCSVRCILSTGKSVMECLPGRSFGVSSVWWRIPALLWKMVLLVLVVSAHNRGPFVSMV